MQCGRRRCFGLVVAMTGLAAGSSCSQTQHNPAPTPTDFSLPQTRIPGEYLVTLTAGADVKAIADLYGRFGIKNTRLLGPNVFLLTLNEDPGPAKVEEVRKQSAQIKAIQPNFVYRGIGRGNTK